MVIVSYRVVLMLRFTITGLDIFLLCSYLIISVQCHAESILKASTDERIYSRGKGGGPMKILIPLIICFVLFVLSLMVCRTVQATLGEPAESVVSDRKALSAVQGAAIVHGGYTIQEVKSDAVSVREYISPSGIVFGIAWNGLIHPDLTPLLGSYAGEYEEALKQTPRKRGRRFSEVRGARIVVEKWGHMRNLQGRAYAPALMPPGVSVNEIK